LFAVVCWIGSELVYTEHSGRFLKVARRIAVVAAITDVLEVMMTLAAIDAKSARYILGPESRRPRTSNGLR
jgi:hypothetical protein